MRSICCNETVSRPTPGDGEWTCDNCHGPALPPAGLGPWESALWQAKALAHATGHVTASQTDAWAIRVGEDGLGFWGTYSATGEFVPFFPVGTPAGFVALAKRVYV
jgi:hypothetical protein